MAHKIIQLKDGNDNLYPTEYYRTASLDSTKFPSSITSNSSALWKVGSVVTLYLNLRSSVTGSTVVLTQGCVPAGFRPPAEISIIGGDGSITGQSVGSVLANGQITLYFGSTGYFQGTACYGTNA